MDDQTPQANLAASISSSVTDVTVDNTRSFPESSSFRVIIGIEIMLVRYRTGNVLHVTRGYEGSIATIHSTGDLVTAILTPKAIASLPSSVLARLASLAVDNDVLRSVHVDAFGAVADADGSTSATGIATGTDNADAFEAAIRSLDPERGGIVQLGFGQYRLGRMVVVDRPCIIVGMGGNINRSGTTLWLDYRVTAFRVGMGTLGLTVTGGDDSGFGSKFRDICIRAVARDSAITSGDWTYATASVTMPDASATRFIAGQLISVGAANQTFTLSRVFGTTRAGFKTVFITGSDANSSRGLFIGQYLQIGTAFPSPSTRLNSIPVNSAAPATYSAGATYAVDDVVVPTAANDHVYAVESGPGVGGSEPVWSTSGGTAASGGGVVFRDLGIYKSGATYIATVVKMAANAATSLTGEVVKERGSLYARIKTKTSLAGTTTLLTDASNGAGDDLTGVDIRDASAAIDMRYQAKVSGVTIYGFEGPAVAILTNGLSDQNANTWQMYDVFAHTCRNAVVCHGQNSQAGVSVGLNSVQAREWAVIDDTQAGNAWLGNHADGGYGFLIRDGVTATIVGAYHETGTFSAYSDGTVSWGGTGSSDFGGTSQINGTFNRVNVGDTSIHTHRIECDPGGGWERYLHAGGSSSGLRHRRSTVAAEGAAGWHLWSHDHGGTRRSAMAISDDDTPAGIPVGTMLFPRGFLIGSTNSNTLDDTSYMIRFYVCDSEPGNQLFDANADTGLWRIGDVVFVTGKGTLEKAAILRCTREGKSAPQWQPNKVVAVGERMRLSADDGFVYECSAFGSVPHKTGVLEPTAGATIVGDGDIDWTRTAAVSATFDRVGGDLARIFNTVNATPKRVGRYPIADGTVRSNRWVIRVESADGSGAVMGEWNVSAAHKRIAGTASQAYAPVITNTFVIGAPGAPTVTLNGDTDVDLNVTGIAATGLVWTISEFSL